MDNNKCNQNQKEKGLDDLIQVIKKVPSYPIIEKCLKFEANQNNAEFIGAFIMLESLQNKKLFELVNDVALDLLFGLIAQKLTYEIMEGKENDNAGTD